MKSKTALVLAILLVLCMAFLVLKNAGVFTPSAPSATEEKTAVFEKAPAGVVKITLAPANGPRLVLAKQDDEWRIEAPFRAKADTYKVNTLLDTVARIKASRSFAPGDKNAVDAKITSLDAPLWIVDMEGAVGAAWKLDVGKPLPLRPGETYVRPGGGDRVFVALGDLADTLSKPARDYRSKTVLQFNSLQAVDIELGGREVRGTYEIQKQKDDWGIVKPYSARADRNTVLDILGDLSYLGAASFVSDEPGPLGGYGLEEGKERLVVRVTIQPEANAAPKSPDTRAASAPTQPSSLPAAKVYAVAFGERTDDKVFARVLGEPAVFQVSASTVDTLLKKLEGLRRSTLLDVDAEAVSGIELCLPDGNATLVKQADGWQMTAPHPGKAGSAAVADLLAKLAALKAQSWADPAAAPAGSTGMEKPFGRITLAYAGKDTMSTLLIGASLPSEETYVKTATGTALALVKTSDTMPLMASAASYWDPSVFSLPYDFKATRLVVTRRDGNFVLARQGDSWKVQSPATQPADETLVTKVLHDLSSVTANKVVYLGGPAPEKYAKAVHNLSVSVYGQRPLEPASRPSPHPSSATASAPASAPVAGSSDANGAAASGGVPTSKSAAGEGPASSQPSSQPTTLASSLPTMGPEALAGVLQIVKVEGKAYVWQPAARPMAIGEMPAYIYEDLAGELRNKTVWRVEANDVIRFKLLSGPERVELRREGEDWVNILNPDEKVDAEKVRTYLADVKEISAERFITDKLTPTDANKLGLEDPWAVLELRLAAGKTLKLTISQRGQDMTLTRYAAGGEVEGIFVLSAETVGKLARKLADFRKSAASRMPE